MNKTGMDNAVCSSCPASQAVQIFEITAVYFSPRCPEFNGRFFRTGKPQYMVPGTY
jgi:hypothetical protein